MIIYKYQSTRLNVIVRRILVSFLRFNVVKTDSEITRILRERHHEADSDDDVDEKEEQAPQQRKRRFAYGKEKFKWSLDVPEARGRHSR
ncbi:hypothetical protein PV325_008113 [Microctonus aethiopoides]|nr:hypothetical protein PV325_008113 [Microctonus aethiopoides]